VSDAYVSSPFDVQPGFVLDRYDLVRQIGQGGMGAVWMGRLAGKHGFERSFAIKLMSAKHGADERFREMFLDEARIASQIHHPNVAQIFDLGEQDGILYLVMEWIEGESLQFLFRQARAKKIELPLGVVLRILADTASGLHAAHELRGPEGELLDVVHRDVSPHNVLVGRAGVSKVIDFGIAKARNRLVSDTSTGSIKGKVRYMAPEQALGRRVDRRTDLWAVGAMLNEYILGKPLYDGDNDIVILQRLFRGETPIVPREGTPEPLYDVLDRTLRTDPDSRFDTGAALATALEEAAEALGVATKAAGVAAYLERELGSHFVAQADSLARAMSSLGASGAHPRLAQADLARSSRSHARASGADLQAAGAEGETESSFTRAARKRASSSRRMVRIAGPAMALAVVGTAGVFVARRASTPLPAASASGAPVPEAVASSPAVPDPRGAAREIPVPVAPAPSSVPSSAVAAAPPQRGATPTGRPASRSSLPSATRAPVAPAAAPRTEPPVAAPAAAAAPEPSTRRPVRRLDDDETIQ
jgi:serine/threonine-protein kinase